MCPGKQTAEPNLLILVSFFSREVTSYTDTSYYIYIYIVGCMPVRFFMGHPVFILAVYVTGQEGDGLSFD